MSNDMKYPPHVLSEEEIELYLTGDRREIDRLILFSINRLTAVIVPHAHREDERDQKFAEVMTKMGGMDEIIARTVYVDAMRKDEVKEAARKRYIDALITRQERRNMMMEKVTTSNIAWASVAFVGYLLYSMREALVAYLVARGVPLK
jgi:hypothetical protein